jgi:hypothetical protein
MNTIDFSQTGGFPFDQSTFDFLQNQSLLVQQLAQLVGQTAIISGCAVSGGSAANGFVVIAGEVLPFVGGALQTKVIIVENHGSVAYQDAVGRTVKKIRYATFGDDGITTLLWANFKVNTTTGVLKRLDDIEAAITGIDAVNTTEDAEITALQSAVAIKLVSGFSTVGDADTNHTNVGSGTIVTISFGTTLADTNYALIFDVISEASDPQQDLYHSVNVRRKGTTSFDLYFREAAINPSQYIAIDWMVLKK